MMSASKSSLPHDHKTHKTPAYDDRSDFELSVFAAIVAAAYVMGWTPWAPPALIAVDVLSYIPETWIKSATTIQQLVAGSVGLNTATFLFTNVAPAALVTKAMAAMFPKAPGVVAQIVPGIRRRAAAPPVALAPAALAHRRALVLAVVPMYRRYGHIDPLTVVKLIQQYGGADSEYKDIVEAFVRANLHSHLERPTRFFTWLVRYHRSVAQVDAAAAADAAVAVKLPTAHDYAGVVEVLRRLDELPYLAIGFNRVVPHLVAPTGPLGAIPLVARQFYALASLTDYNLFLLLQIYDANLWQLCPEDVPGKPTSQPRTFHQLRDGSETVTTYDPSPLTTEAGSADASSLPPNPQLPFTDDDALAEVAARVVCPVCAQRLNKPVTTERGIVCCQQCHGHNSDAGASLGADPVPNPTMEYVIAGVAGDNDNKPGVEAGLV